MRLPGQSLLALVLIFRPVAAADTLAEGKEAFASGAYRQAIELLSRVSDHPGVCEASFLLGLSQYRLQQVSNAIVSLEIAGNCPESPAEVAVALAQAYLEQGDHNRAAAALQRALDRDPDNLDALRSLSSIFLRHEMNEQAIPLLERLLAASPADARVHSDLGAAYAGTMNLSKAREQFERSLQLKPDNTAALVGLSSVYIKSDDAASALPLLTRAINAGAGTYEAFYLRGVVHAREKRYRDAIADLTRALEQRGNVPEIYFRLSSAYQAAGDTDQSRRALETFKALRARAEQQAESVRQVARLTEEARTFVQRGELMRAAETLEQARQLQTQDAQLHYRLASLYLDMNRIPEAAERGHAAVQLAPGEWRHRYLLGVIELRRGDLSAARDQLEIAARLNGSAAEVLNALGDVAMRARHYAEAIRYFSGALRLRPNEQAYRVNLEAAQASAR